MGSGMGFTPHSASANRHETAFIATSRKTDSAKVSKAMHDQNRKAPADDIQEFGALQWTYIM
jgi:hypothetical protein